jgi:HPt (histidine-containing phosphotransfer) domain-containing protein
MKVDPDCVYKLDKLIEYIGTDEEVIKNMIGIFLTTTPDLLSQVLAGLQSENYDEIAKNVHKLKPTLDIFGIDSLHDPIRSIENYAKQKKNIQKIAELIALLEKTLEKVIFELKKDFSLS